MFLNIAAYKFISLTQAKLPFICKALKDAGDRYILKGTVLLSNEGINLFLAGEIANIKQFQLFLNDYAEFKDLSYKNSYSEFIPFKKLFVKLRKEIITFNQPHIQPEQQTASYISPQQLKQWLDQEKELTLLDTRNTTEYEVGSFIKAVHLEIENFREFPQALNQTTSIEKDKPVVTFCTGGIRCEKAAAYLLDQGYQQVYQLEGGILSYFEQCGDQHYQGDCFVFDDRVAVDATLRPTTVTYKVSLDLPA